MYSEKVLLFTETQKQFYEDHKKILELEFVFF